jgi:DNA-binding FadR family transcriptional regulator
MSSKSRGADPEAAPPRPGDLAAVGGAPGIAAELRKAIQDGIYVHGERLPAERALARAWGVSRTTVREALATLEQSGLVGRRRGSGTFVAWEPVRVDDEVADVTSPIELVEVRLALEPTMMRLACRNATPRDLAKLEDTLDRLVAADGDPSRFTKWDRQFHELVAEATHNPLFVALYRQVNHVRGHRQWTAIKDKILTADRIADYNRDHAALLAALRGRNGDRAATLVTEHLQRARQHLMAG